VSTLRGRAAAPCGHRVARRTQRRQVLFDGVGAHAQCHCQVGHTGGSALLGGLPQQAQQLVMTVSDFSGDLCVTGRSYRPSDFDLFVVAQGAAGGGLGARETDSDLAGQQAGSGLHFEAGQVPGYSQLLKQRSGLVQQGRAALGLVSVVRTSQVKPVSSQAAGQLGLSADLPQERMLSSKWGTGSVPVLSWPRFSATLPITR
jgi:hypothetical protein